MSVRILAEAVAADPERFRPLFGLEPVQDAPAAEHEPSPLAPPAGYGHPAFAAMAAARADAETDQ